MNFLGKLKSLALASALFVGGTTAAFADYWVFLGYTYNMQQCNDTAAYYRYPHYIYGGYVNGVYVINACFGYVVTTTPPVDPDHPNDNPDYEALEFDASGISISLVLFDLEIDDTPYDSLNSIVDVAREELEVLKDSIEDRQRLSIVKRKFRELKLAIEALEDPYREIHREHRNRDVGSAYNGIEDAMAEMEEELFQ